MATTLQAEDFLRIPLNDSAEYVRMQEAQVEIEFQALLRRLGIAPETDISSPFQFYSILSMREYVFSRDETMLLLDYFWAKEAPEGLRVIPDSLKEKILDVFGEDYIHLIIETGGVFSTLMGLQQLYDSLSYREEQFLWRVLHRRFPEQSSRDYYLTANIDIVNSMFEQRGRKLRVLDIGCGSKAKALIALQKECGDKIEAFGIDLEITEQNPNVTLREGDIRNMPFEDNFFDLIFEHIVIRYFRTDEEFIVAINEIARVLSPDGEFVTLNASEDLLGKFRENDEQLNVTVRYVNGDIILTKKSRDALGGRARTLRGTI